MKKYDDLTARLLERRDRYVAAQAAKRKRLMRVALPVGGGLLVTLLCVGLWQGGAFENTPPVTDGSGQDTTVPAAPTTATGDSAPTDSDGTIEGADTTTAKPTTTTTTAKPTTTTTAKPTTTTTVKPTATTTKTTAPYILVGGEEDYEGSQSDSVPSLKDRLVSPALGEKMKEYRDVNAVFQVVVFCAVTIEDFDEFADNYLKTSEEYQSLQKQYEEARKTLKEAVKRVYDCEYPDDDPRKDALRQEREDAENKKEELSNKQSILRTELLEKYIDDLTQKRISYAAKYSKTEPISGFGRFGNGYYMELTADAINELADRGGYSFRLASEKVDLSQPRDD